jgi:hypothetical protein
MIEAQNAAHKGWERRKWLKRRKFGEFLEREGFVSLWSAEAGVPTFAVDWGHRHGTRIDYSETELDTLPSPVKVADPDWEDPDAW